MTLLFRGNVSAPMGKLRFGILDGIVDSRVLPTLLPRASYLTAAATGADSFSVGDHLNAMLPKSRFQSDNLGARFVFSRQVSGRGVNVLDPVSQPCFPHTARGDGD